MKDEREFREAAEQLQLRWDHLRAGGVVNKELEDVIKTTIAMAIEASFLEFNEQIKARLVDVSSE